MQTRNYINISKYHLFTLLVTFLLYACGDNTSPNIDDEPILKNYTVTVNASDGGEVSPSIASAVQGDSTQFTITPLQGYIIESVTGCAGTLSGTIYTTGSLSEDCQVVVSFNLAPTHTVSIGNTQANVTTISSGAFGDLNITETTGTDVFIPEDSFIAAYDDRENIVFLDIAEVAPQYIYYNNEIILDAHSTVKALMLLVPNIAMTESDIQGFYEDHIRYLPSVNALLDYIESNTYWITTFEFKELYAKAIQNAEATLVSMEMTCEKKQALGRTVVIDDLSDSGQITPFYSYSKTGINVIVDSKSQGSYTGASGTFSVDISNSFKRWAIAIIGEEPSMNNASLEIDPAKNVFLLAGKGDTETATIPLSIFDDDKLVDFGVHVFGPAFNGNIPQSGQAEAAYWLATLYTFLFEVSLPTFGKVTGADICLNKIFSPSGTNGSVARDLADSNDLRKAIHEKNYQLAAATVGLAVSNAIIGGRPECLTEAGVKLATRLTPIIDQIKLATDVLETSSSTMECGLDLESSEKAAYWAITNPLESSFHMVGKNFINAPSHGRMDYHTVNDLSKVNDEWLPLYNGDCPMDANRAVEAGWTCEAYSYDHEGPYVVAFEVECKEPVNNERVDCSHASVSIQDFEADEDGVVRFELEYPEVGEYYGNVAVFDADGGKSIHEFNVQIKKAEPQLVAYSENGLMQSKVTEGVRKIEKETVISLNENALQGSKIITLRNTGYGKAIIDEISYPDIDGWEVELVNFSLPIELDGMDVLSQIGGKVEIKVTADTSLLNSEELENFTLAIHGTLGNKSIAHGQPELSPQHQEYNKMEIPFTVSSDYQVWITAKLDSSIVDQYIRPNQPLVIENGVGTHIAARDPNNNDVIIGKQLESDDDAYIKLIDFPEGDYILEDIHYGEFLVEFYDYTNQESVSIPVDLTISNKKVRNVLGNRLTLNIEKGLNFDYVFYWGLPYSERVKVAHDIIVDLNGNWHLSGYSSYLYGHVVLPDDDKDLLYRFNCQGTLKKVVGDIKLNTEESSFYINESGSVVDSPLPSEKTYFLDVGRHFMVYDDGSVERDGECPDIHRLNE